MGADEIGAGGDDDGVAFAGVLVEVEGGGDFGAAVDDEAAVGFLELVVGFFGGGFGFGGVAFGVEEGSVGVEVGEVGVLVEVDPGALDLGHAVVGDDDEIDGQVEGVELGLELAHEVVDVEDGGADFGAVGAELVSAMVGLVVVEGDEVGALFGWELEPFDDLVDALFVGELGVEVQVVGWGGRLEWRLRSRARRSRRRACLAARRGPIGGFRSTRSRR